MVVGNTLGLQMCGIQGPCPLKPVPEAQELVQQTLQGVGFLTLCRLCKL